MSTGEVGSSGPKGIDNQKTEQVTKAKQYKFGDTIKGLYNKYISKMESEPKSLEDKTKTQKVEIADTKIKQISQVTTELLKGKQYENMRHSELQNLPTEELKLAKQYLTLLVSDLDIKYRSYDSQIKEMKNKLGTRSDDLSDLNNDIQKKETKTATIEESVSEKESEITEVDKKINSYNEDLQTNKKEIDRLTKQIEISENNIKNLSAGIDQCGLDQLKNSSNLEKKIQDLEKEIKEHKKYIKETPSDSPFINKKKLADTKLALKNAESQLESCENDSITIIDQASKTKFQMQTDITKNKKSIEADKDLLKYTIKLREGNNNKLIGLQSQKDMLTKEYNRIRDDLKTQKNNNNELKMKKSDLEIEILDLNKALDGIVDGPVMERKKTADIPSKYAKDKLNTVENELAKREETSRNQIKI